MPSDQIQYSGKYSDDRYEYRHVILPSDLARHVPKSHLMTESEWRNVGVQQSPDWKSGNTELKWVDVSTMDDWNLRSLSELHEIQPGLLDARIERMYCVCVRVKEARSSYWLVYRKQTIFCARNNKDINKLLLALRK